MAKKKETKKIKVRDLKPRKDTKGGKDGAHMPQGPPNMPMPDPTGPPWRT